MENKNIYIEADVYATWIEEPIYRIWINGELICERTFWPNPNELYIREMISVELPTGDHHLSLEQLDLTRGRIWINELRITDVAAKTSSVTLLSQHNGRFQDITFQA